MNEKDLREREALKNRIENFLDSACSTLSLDDPEDRRTCAQNLAEWIFEHVVAWNCTHPKLRRKKNAHTDREKWKSPPGIARRDLGDKPPSIPEWCPLRKKEKA